MKTGQATTEAPSPAPSPQGTPTELAGSPNLPPVGEYKEAFSAIDDIPATGFDGKHDDPPPKPADRSPEPKPGDRDDPKPGKEDPKPSKRRLPEDIDGLVKPKPKADSGKKPEDEKVEDSEFEAEAVPKRLRETYRATKENLTKAEQRVRELEETVEKAKKETADSVRTEYEKKLEDIDRRRAELETELRFSNYSKSEEYKEKYHGPLREAWKETLAGIEGMTVEDSEGNTREVNSDDISRLMAMPNAQARKVATEMFGTAASEIMQYRAKLMGLTTARDKALEEWRTKGSEREAQMAKDRQAMVKSWESDIQGYQTDYPELFGKRDGDADGNALIDAGNRLARKAFLAEGIPDGLTPEQRREEVLGAQTMTALRAMAYPRVLRDLNAAKSEIEELKSKLAEYQGTEPEPGGKPSRGGTSGSGKEATPEDAIDSIIGEGY